MASGSSLASTDQKRDSRSSSSETSSITSSGVHPRSSASTATGWSASSGCERDSATEMAAQLSGNPPALPLTSSHAVARQDGSR